MIPLILTLAQALLSKKASNDAEKGKEGKAGTASGILGAVGSLGGGGGGSEGSAASKFPHMASGQAEAGTNLRGPMMGAPSSRMMQQPTAQMRPAGGMAPPAMPTGAARGQMTPIQQAAPAGSPLSPLERNKLAFMAGQMANDAAATLTGGPQAGGAQLQRAGRRPLTTGFTPHQTPGVFANRGVQGMNQPTQMGGPMPQRPMGPPPQAPQAPMNQTFAGNTFAPSGPARPIPQDVQRAQQTSQFILDLERRLQAARGG